MSDRTQGSVRTGSRSGDTPASKETSPGEPVPVSSTQAIPTTGTQRAQTAGTAGSGDGVQATAGNPPVPPPAAPPRTGIFTAAPSAGSASAAARPAAAAPGAGAPVAGPPAAGTTATATTASPATPTAATGSGTAVGTPPAVSAGTATRTAGDTGTAAGARGRTTGKAAGRGPRRARLQLRHIDTWSALKISLVLSIALFCIWMVAVGVLYGVLSGLGVFDTLNDLFGQLGTASGATDGGGDVITLGVVFWGAAVIGAINIVLLTALCTVATFIYNLCSDLVGGLEVTLSERD